MRKLAFLLPLCAAFTLISTDAALAKQRKKEPFFPNVNVQTQNGNSFLGVPLNQNNQTYSLNKRGVQYKTNQGDWFSRNSQTIGVKRDGQININQKSNNGWPF
ncbi:MAG: hypothetical protein J0I12_13605 [Candidatus Eremiobacteraeota bacterium]|mgnify:CR=1 FL=1|nr:hypothetical protein [Candidatus Eremiobacteraeota bacterium]